MKFKRLEIVHETEVIHEDHPGVYLKKRFTGNSKIIFSVNVDSDKDLMEELRVVIERHGLLKEQSVSQRALDQLKKFRDYKNIDKEWPLPSDKTS